MPTGPTPQVPVTEPQPIPNRIAFWSENILVRSIKRIFNALAEPIRNLLRITILDTMEDLENELIDAVTPFLDYTESIPNVPEWMRVPIRKIKQRTSPIDIILLVGVAIAIIGILIQILMSGLSKSIEPYLNKLLRNYLIEPSLALLLRQRNYITPEQYREILRLNGIPEEGINWITRLEKGLIDDDLLTTALWRNRMSKEDIATILRQKGMTEQAIGFWFETRELIPTPSDLVSIAVREGFDDKVASDFGYDENFPSLAAQAAEKSGLATEWFQKLWRAHWTLPGASQGFEMFQRGIIKDYELDTLLRTLDIPSFWRNNLIKLSYSLITRVDLRRIYDLGLIEPERLLIEYQKQGYSPEDAALITEWTVAEYGEEQRQLTKTEILNMYRTSVLEYNEAVPLLKELKYNDETINLFIQRENLKREQEFEKEYVENIEALYLGNYISRTDVHVRFGIIGATSAFVENKLTIWDLQKIRRVKRPSKSEIKDLMLSEIITPEKAKEELAAQGYGQEYISWYINLWSGGIFT